MSSNDFDFLKPLNKYGFSKLDIKIDKDIIKKIDLITRSRKIMDLKEGELQLRSEVHHMLGSELITYGLEKLITLFSRIRSGEEKKELKSILKYHVIRMEPNYDENEKKRVDELYYNKVNAPVKRVIDVVEDRVKKSKDFVEDTDKYVRGEARDLAFKEIGKRIRRTGEDLGFDVNQITKRSEQIFGRILNVLSDEHSKKIEPIEYRAYIRSRMGGSLESSKPQLTIHQTESGLRIMGGSLIDEQFDDVSPELLEDALQFMLLSKAEMKKDG
ncbi:MAG: hypothetical protein EAX96_11170 [Candidatus Lokiarchaeota archaeon]|nr:hypothetical protein [Candidatus Lokiarchaeota archaeon]